MQFWKNSKNLINLSLICGLCILTAACVDLIAPSMRKGEQLAKTQYYGLKSDYWQQIEDAYMAGQANCCGADKINDDIKALNYYCEAAKLGHKASQIEIARLYTHQAGAGPKTAIPFDRTLAHAYYSLAAQGGYEFAASLKNDLTEKLSKEELARSAQLVVDYPNIPCEITK